jgi:hypothetical protein
LNPKGLEFNPKVFELNPKVFGLNPKGLDFNPKEYALKTLNFRVFVALVITLPSAVFYHAQG